MAEAGSSIAWNTPRSLTDTLRTSNFFVTTTASGTARIRISPAEEQLIRKQIRFFPIDWPVANPIIVDSEDTTGTVTYIGRDNAIATDVTDLAAAESVIEIAQPAQTATDPVAWIEANWANMRGHAGEWVVLGTGPNIELIGFGPTFPQAMALAIRSGVRTPFVAKVPPENLPTLIP